MIPQNQPIFKHFFLSLLVTFFGLSNLKAQDAIILAPPQVGYDTTIVVTIVLRDLPPLTNPVKIGLPGYVPDFKADSITVINDSTLSVRIYTGSSADTGLNPLVINYGEKYYTTSNGILIYGSRLQFDMQSPNLRRGYTRTCDFVVEPHLTTTFEEDSIISITCYDDQGNISPNIVCDSFQMGIENQFSLNIHVNEAVHSGTFKLVIATQKNGLIKLLFTIKPPQISPIGITRGTAFPGTLNYYDVARNVLFVKGGPNIVKVYRNGALRTDITIDSVKATTEERLYLYGNVAPNAEFGNYDIIVQNQFDTLSLVFTVFKPQIQSISSRRVNRNDSTMRSITMQYANLTKGITTLSLLDPADSAFIRISNFSVTNANNCKFLVQVDSLAPLGNYYFQLTNSFDTISIIDSFYISKGSIIALNTPSIPSESKSIIELKGTNTLFTHGPVSLWAKASDNGTITVDSFKIINDTKITLWLTADALAEGTGRIYFYSPTDDSINVSSSFSIKRPTASMINKQVTMGLNDMAITTITGSLTHFKRVNHFRFTYKNTNMETVYDTGRLSVVNYTAVNDSSLSLTIHTDVNDLPKGLFTIVLVDSVSGELVTSTRILLVTPALGSNFRKKIKKQANDTLWVPLTYFSESQMAHIDSISVGDMARKSVSVTGYAYKSVGNQKGILLNLHMNKTVSSNDWCAVTIAWDYKESQVSQSEIFEILKPVFVSKSTPDLTLNDSTHCWIVFDGLYEDSATVIALFNAVTITNTKVKGDTVEFDVKLENKNDLYYYISTPSEYNIYESKFKIAPSVGLKEIADATSFNVYPVPAGNSIFIRSTDNSTIQSIVIYDMLGKSFTSKGNNKTEQQLEISGMTSGAYSMFINTPTGTVVKRFLKE